MIIYYHNTWYYAECIRSTEWKAQRKQVLNEILEDQVDRIWWTVRFEGLGRGSVFVCLKAGVNIISINSGF